MSEAHFQYLRPSEVSPLPVVVLRRWRRLGIPKMNPQWADLRHIPVVNVYNLRTGKSASSIGKSTTPMCDVQ
jgi:hypothetical protein